MTHCTADTAIILFEANNRNIKVLTKRLSDSEMFLNDSTFKNISAN